MPQKRRTERTVIVRIDADGSMLDYKVVGGKHRSRRHRRHAKSRQMRADESESRQEEREYENIPLIDSPVEKPPRVGRPKSSTKIFTEKLYWSADPKVDTHNHEAMKRIRHGPPKKIFDEPIYYPVEAKVDTHNEYAIDTSRHQSRSQIYSEKPVWYAEPKVDSHNEEFIHREPKHQIINDKLTWEKVTARIDTHNENAIDHQNTIRKPTILSRKLQWTSAPQVDAQNPEYLEYKQYDEVRREEQLKSRAQSNPEEERIIADRPRVDHYNFDYIEERKQRRKSFRLPRIEDQKLEWEKKARINHRQDDYIARVQQRRAIPIIYHKKLEWETKTPRVDDHNDDYLAHVKDQQRPKIINKLPQWRKERKIDTFQKVLSQNPDSHLPPISKSNRSIEKIINEKPRWNARSKIDTSRDPHHISTMV